MRTNVRPVAVDLFCGVGGMSLGFDQAGFDVVAAVDIDPIHVATYAKNFPNCRALVGDLSAMTGDDIRMKAELGNVQIDVVFGGPPCQGFSMIGKRRPNDPRNFLLEDFARLVTELRPAYFVAENVEGLLAGEARAFLQSFVDTVDRSGYDIVDPIGVLDAAYFGVPQRRRRVFILGWRRGAPPAVYPAPLHGENGKEGRHSPVVWDAISDLPEVDRFDELLVGDVYRGELGPPTDYAKVLRNGFCTGTERLRQRRDEAEGLTGCRRTIHASDTVRRFEATEPGTYEPTSRFYRLDKDGLAYTLRAGTGPSNGSFTAPRPIHPVSPRCITVREGARLHSFPDWFRFHPTKWHGFRQIGNSVPPLLAGAVAARVYDALAVPAARVRRTGVYHD